MPPYRERARDLLLFDGLILSAFSSRVEVGFRYLPRLALVGPNPSVIVKSLSVCDSGGSDYSSNYHVRAAAPSCSQVPE
jgi:hypothetical protein